MRPRGGRTHSPSTPRVRPGRKANPGPGFALPPAQRERAHPSGYALTSVRVRLQLCPGCLALALFALLRSSASAAARTLSASRSSRRSSR